MNPPLLDAADSAADESRVAGALARRGLHSGDRLALSLPGSCTYLSVVLGALRSGLAPFPLARPMHMTSGTTGQPKGVWSGILSPEHAGALVAEERELWGFIESDVNLVVSPIYHSAPLRFAIGTLLAGGSVAVLDHFDAAEFAASVDELRPTSRACCGARSPNMPVSNTGTTRSRLPRPGTVLLSPSAIWAGSKTDTSIWIHGAKTS